MSTSKYLPSLDGLRGLAILMVIAHNCLLMDPAGQSIPVLALYKLLDSGWVGVTLFFALSGYLITGILLDTQGQPRAWWNFTVRRALRIFPPYYLFLVVMFVLLPWWGLQPEGFQAGAENRIWLWTYLINWFQSIGQGVGAVPHFWSLAIEEQFYLIWPPLILACRQPQHVLWLCLFTIAVSVGTRAWMAHQGGMNPMIYTWTITRMDALVYGGLAAWWIRQPGALDWFTRHRQVLHGVVLAVVLMATVYTSLFPRTSLRGFVVGYAVLGMAFAYLVLVMAQGDAQGPSRWTAWARLPWLMELGKVSYGVYIVHKPLSDFGGTALLKATGLDASSPVGSVLYLLALVLVCYGVAKLSFELFEKPLLKLKRHFV
jgi:peptidoglycan/LPS O-acetylase OafA/YrhL